MRDHKTNRQQISAGSRRAARKTQTTLRLPRKLYEQAKLLVEREKSGSVNDFIVRALTAYVRAMERKAVDDAFKDMAEDKRYHRDALQVAEQFAASDAEAIELSERDLVGA